MLGGASGFDPANNIVWLQLGTNAGQIYLYGFNIITKQQVFKVLLHYSLVASLNFILFFFCVAE